MPDTPRSHKKQRSKRSAGQAEGTAMKESIQEVQEKKASKDSVGGDAEGAVSTSRGMPMPNDGDWARLAEGELLNDALLDYFLGHLTQQHGEGRVHNFSTLFFSRLRHGGWAEVKTWTRKLRRQDSAGIFSRDFLLVPIHDEGLEHWWLAIVCFPWAAASESPGPGVLRPGRQAHVDGTSVMFMDSLLLAGEEGDDTELTAELTKREAAVLEALTEYLDAEWVSMFETVAFDKDRVRGVRVTVPQQQNQADCGVYVLEFARQLLEPPGALDAFARKCCLGRAARGSEGVLPASAGAKRKKKKGDDDAAAVAGPSFGRIGKDPRSYWRDLGSSLRKAHLQRPSSTSGPSGRKRGRACAGPSGAAKQQRIQEKEEEEGSTQSITAAAAAAARTSGAHRGDRMASSSPIILWLSGAVEMALKAKEKASLVKMGAQICEDEKGASATHVVLGGNLRRTLRVMCAVCRGQQIVHFNWLKVCLQERRWVNEEDFLPVPARDGKSGWEASYGKKELAAAIARARVKPLLSGWRILVLPSVQERTVIEEVVTAAGAKLMDKVPPEQKKKRKSQVVESRAAGDQRILAQKAPEERLLLIGSESDRLARRYVSVYREELVLQAAMAQALELEKYHL